MDCNEVYHCTYVNTWFAMILELQQEETIGSVREEEFSSILQVSSV